jgi:DNA polymerase-3 subunit delta'
VREIIGEVPGAEAAVALASGVPRRAYEALALGEHKGLESLAGWLKAPGQGASALYLGIADALAAERDGAAYGFGRQMLLGWIAGEATSAATVRARARLASANELWEKANALFADADTYNLDARQTLISLFDAVRRHAQTHLAPAEAR